LVVLGGGDGTMVMSLALIAEACRGEGRPEPAIGILRLGAGNALASSVGASEDPADDLARLGRGEGHWRPGRMLDVLKMRAPFVGMGVDAQLLEDQAAIGRVVDRVPGGRFLGGGARYALSVALRSLPRFATGGRPTAVVTNLGAPAIEMSRLGPTGRTIPTGAVLWTGSCTLVAASTIPHFGFGLRMFPFAETREDRFQLRCGDGGLLEIVRNTPAAFRGEYFSEHVRDFLCDRIAVEIDPISDGEPGAAIEAGGELLGRARRLELGMAPSITLATLGR
ncbi:MAG: hypothetical protein H0T79_11905, partial [Deltaproteobacteria bacterium]|nr:hypothetical protein [Deltaproteobacteria bacterium]